jgi:ABC-type sugar transport system substrate-binding protein
MLKYSVAFFSALVLVGVALPNALADAKGKKVAHLTTAIQLPYISTLAKSLTEAGASYGMDVTVFSSPFDPAIQSQQMDDAVARRFDMIILTAVSEQAIVPALTRANQAGIPVIALIDPPKAGTEKLYTSFVGDDQPELGRIAARSMLKAIKASGRDGGRIAAITGALQEGVAPLRLNAFREVIKQDPKVELVAVEDVAWDTAKSEQAAGQLLARFAPQGGLAGIWGMADNQAVAIIQAVKAAGLTPGIGAKDVIVVSSNCYKDGVAAIKAGTLFSTASQVPTTAGKRAAEAANEYFNGKTLPPRIIIPVDLINKDNIDKWAEACSF